MARILVNMPSQFGGKPSGVSRVAFALLGRLLALGGHDYVLRSNWRRDALPDALRQSALELVEVPRPGIMSVDVVRQLVTVPALCRARGIDIVWNVDPFGAACGGRARVTTIHDLYFHSVPDLVGRRAAGTMRLCYGLVIRASTRIVAISRYTLNEAATLYPASAARMIEIANDATLAAPAGGLPKCMVGEPYLLLVGNGTPNKNLGLAVAALARLPEADRPLLVHVGLDEGGQLATALAAEAHPPRLHSLSDVDDAALAGLYAHALALVVPSLAEGFCLPIVEAQEIGCPVIASSASVMPEVAGDAALFFDPRDAADLAGRIAKLGNDAFLRADLIARGHANRRRFSWDASAARYAALFSELAGSA